MSKGCVVWFTGLSGSGKTSLANTLARILKNEKFLVEVIDGDEFRKKKYPNLRFTPKEIKINNKKILKYCLQNLKEKDFILIPAIAPFNSTRQLVKNRLGKSYVEIYCKAPLSKLIKRDPKGLYKKALKGELINFIGISKDVPYEEPTSPNIVVNTTELTVEQSTDKILDYLIKSKIL